MINFLYKYIPPRPDFFDTMTAVDADLLMAQREWQKTLLLKQQILACGMVVDAKWAYVVTFFRVRESDDIENIIVQDPMLKAGVGRYEYHPMIEIMK